MSQPYRGGALEKAAPWEEGHSLGGALPHGQHDPDPARVRVRRRQEGEEGDRLDARTAAHGRGLELQLSREEGQAQQLHVYHRTVMGLFRDSACKMEPEDETVRRAGSRILADAPNLQE